MEYSILSDSNKLKQWKDEVGSYMNILGVNEYTERLTVEGENLEGEVCVNKSLDSMSIYVWFESGSIEELYVKTDEISIEFEEDVHIENLYVDKEVEYIKMMSHCPGIVDKLHVFNLKSLTLSSISIRELHLHMDERFHLDSDFGYYFLKMFQHSVRNKLFIYYCVDTLETGIDGSMIDEAYKIGGVHIDKTVQVVWFNYGKVEVNKGHKNSTLYIDKLSKKDIENLYKIVDNAIRMLLKQININLVTFIHG